MTTGLKTSVKATVLVYCFYQPAPYRSKDTVLVSLFVRLGLSAKRIETRSGFSSLERCAAASVKQSF